MEGNKTYERFCELLEEMRALSEKKSHDYGGADPISNLREFGWEGVVVRLSDKYHRLANFVKQGELQVKNESIKDTLMDNANYSLLALILLEEEENGKE